MKVFKVLLTLGLIVLGLYTFGGCMLSDGATDAERLLFGAVALLCAGTVIGIWRGWAGLQRALITMMALIGGKLVLDHLTLQQVTFLSLPAAFATAIFWSGNEVRRR